MFTLDADDSVEVAEGRETSPEITEMKRVIEIVNEFVQFLSSPEGITAFQVVCDETNNTPQTIDNQELVVDVWVPRFVTI